MSPAPGPVLILSGVRGDTRRYRSFHPYQQLRLAGVDCWLSHVTDPQLPVLVEQAGVVIFHRASYDSYVERLISILHRQGKLAILDVDDLVFDPSAFRWIASPDFKDPVRAALYQQDMRRHRQTLDACQAVTASTQYLADQVKTLGKPTWVHRNAFSLEMRALSDAAYAVRQSRSENGPSERLVIGYGSGTATHNLDFELAKPALKQVLQRYPQTELWLIGPLDPGQDWPDGYLDGEAPRIRRFPLLPWRELPARLAQFDINLAPLVAGNPFGQSKSEIKYMEAALVRVPTIASPTDAFRYAIQSGKNSLLAANEQEWMQALCTLVEQDELRRAMGERAYAHASEQYSPERRARELTDTLDEIARTVQGRSLWPAGRPAPAHDSSSQAFWLAPELESRPSLTQMGLYTLRHRSAKALLMQVWIFFRRLVAPIFPYG